MSNVQSPPTKSRQPRVIRGLKEERSFMFVMVLLFLIAGAAYPYPKIAMWIGFALAGYSAVANDSIQTIGTFIASNARQRWWHLWLFIGLIFVATVTVSWMLFDGDVTYQRLSTKGFEQSPTKFAFLQVAAPIFLLILTRLRMPVSTTFLLLSSFTSHSHAIVDVLVKSLLGYIIAFGTAGLVWYLLAGWMNKLLVGQAHPVWNVAQWLTSGTLWAIWIMQDAANIAVYLPRQLNAYQFLVFTGILFMGLGLIFYLKGDKIQQIVNEKSHVTDVRAATLIDLVYALILFVFQWISTVPMSTTWVFIGLLGGRELAIRAGQRSADQKKAMRMMGKDVLYATVGLLVSIIIAAAVNPTAYRELLLYLLPN